MPKSNLLKSYGGPPTSGKPGEVEAWAMMQAALRMKDAVEGGDSDAIMAAVRLNWRMWTIFQAELLDPQSTVPIDIRGNLISLANFIDKQTVSFFAESTSDKLDILISINRDLAAGLYETPPVESAAATGPAASAQNDQNSPEGSDQPPANSSVKISI